MTHELHLMERYSHDYVYVRNIKGGALCVLYCYPSPRPFSKLSVSVLFFGCCCCHPASRLCLSRSSALRESFRTVRLVTVFSVKFHLFANVIFCIFCNSKLAFSHLVTLSAANSWQSARAGRRFRLALHLWLLWLRTTFTGQPARPRVVCDIARCDLGASLWCSPSTLCIFFSPGYYQ